MNYPHRLALDGSSVQFDEHEVIGVAGVGITRVGDGFDPLEHLLPRFISRGQRIVAKTDFDISVEGMWYNSLGTRPEPHLHTWCPPQPHVPSPGVPSAANLLPRITAPNPSSDGPTQNNQA